MDALGTVIFLFLGLVVLNIIYLLVEGKRLDWSEAIINSAFLWLVVGTPLLFSASTRSVFEVWKLLLLRLVILLVFTTWITKRVLIAEKSPFKFFIGNDKNKAGNFSFLGLSWQKTGLEWPIFAWAIVNILAVVFSKNIYIAIIGSYDRWEGIITVFNYIFLFFMFAKLIKKENILMWILLAIFGSTAISAVYAIFQSLGMDFMNWSADPTARTFACINNPVHYSAYIAMVVPLGIGFLLYQSDDKDSFFQGFLNYKNFALLALIQSLVILLALYFNLHILVLLSLFLFAGIFIWNGFTFNNKNILSHLLKVYTIIALGLIYYSMYISYGRGTWIGFALAMIVFYLILSGVIFYQKRKLFLLDFFVSMFIISLFFVAFVFNLYKKGMPIMLPLALIIALYVAFTYFISKKEAVVKKETNLLEVLSVSALSFILLSFSYLQAYFLKFTSQFSLNMLFAVFGLLAFIYSIYLVLKDEAWRKVALRFVIIWLFVTLPFISFNFKNLIIYAVLSSVFFFLCFYFKDEYLSSFLDNTEKKAWIFIFLVLFGITLTLPVFKDNLASLFAEIQDNILGKPVVSTDENIRNRMMAFEEQALGGSPRMSMWQTSLGWAGVPYPYFKKQDSQFKLFLHSTAWIDGVDFKSKIKAYPLFGTGQDTVKEMYPYFRRADYGRLEGGHNLTPDRVHNEYLNMLITTGFLGAGIKYLWVMLAYFIIVLTAILKYGKNKYSYLIIGAMAGVLVYLGQVLFNFGVVATKVLFYVLMGFSIAIITHNIGLKKNEQETK